MKCWYSKLQWEWCCLPKNSREAAVCFKYIWYTLPYHIIVTELFHVNTTLNGNKTAYRKPKINYASSVDTVLLTDTVLAAVLCRNPLNFRNNRFFSYPKRPDRLWGPASLLFKRYWGSYPGKRAIGAWSQISTSPYAFTVHTTTNDAPNSEVPIGPGHLVGIIEDRKLYSCCGLLGTRCWYQVSRKGTQWFRSSYGKFITK